ncbi:Uncharacterized protein TCM_043388 [Theobroma cacao]|uniref:FAR1 domain-containing protein n=1 Tax=Theobroma cacao TaxID=3641 RepID=A0A061FVQ2_THECC|nr:Uncharacterized protein TCM_043388 [Theobroma cacao]
MWRGQQPVKARWPFLLTLLRRTTLRLSLRQSDGFWVLHLRNASHNHEPSSNMSAHPSYGHLKRGEIVDIEKLSISRIQSR